MAVDSPRFAAAPLATVRRGELSSEERGPREESMNRQAGVVVLAFLLSVTTAAAEKDGAVRIGVLNDMSSVYADFQGPGSVIAAQLAIEDFAKQSKRKAEVVGADHLNKPDVGAAIARRW